MLWGRYASQASEARYPQLWQGRVFAACPSAQGPAGLNLYDLSGRGRHATLNNMDAPTDWLRSTGRFALDMDGSNDFVQFPATTATTQQTVSIHVSLRTAGVIVGGGNDTYALYVDPLNATGSVYYAASSGVFVSVVHGGLASQWAHLAVVRRGLSVTFFKNGIQIGATRTLGSDIAQSLTYIAREGKGFNSSMQWDDVAVYNRGLTAGEIRLLATRRGIAYEARRDIVFGSSGFSAYWARRQNQIIGGGV